MKAVILAGALGTRISEEINIMAKPIRSIKNNKKVNLRTPNAVKS